MRRNHSFLHCPWWTPTSAQPLQRRTPWFNLGPCSLDSCSLDWFGSSSLFIYSFTTLLTSLSGNFHQTQHLKPNFSSARGLYRPWSLHLPNPHWWGTMDLVPFTQMVISYPGIPLSLTYTCVTRVGDANNWRCRVSPTPTSTQEIHPKKNLLATK